MKLGGLVLLRQTVFYFYFILTNLFCCVTLDNLGQLQIASDDCNLNMNQYETDDHTSVTPTQFGHYKSSTSVCPSLLSITLFRTFLLWTSLGSVVSDVIVFVSVVRNGGKV